MYLKSIEVQGFKSFAHKMLFEFQEGITGIVGPNGSGKSNVADAVRWVLGEQSAKQLRGGNMQDVIFAGTELRKPQSFASVAITLDNSDHKLDIDYEEVKVTRRLYRSGESEYLINENPVRLKDINELFYDTGIGKEGYSIIGQGQIEKILSSKPEERRELFDEAAGVVKFKRRKATAVKKLEEEQQNLLRVNDILRELTSQLEPLRKQSESAKIYLDKKQNLKELDINMFLIEMEHIEGQLSDINEKAGIAQGDMDETSKKFEQTKAEYEKLEHDMEEIDRLSSEVHEDTAAKAMSIQQMTGQIELLNEQINTVHANDEHYKNRRAAIAEETTKRQEEKNRHREEQEHLDAEIASISEEQKTESGKLTAFEKEIDELSTQIEKTKAELIELLNSRATVKGRMQRYDAMLEQIDIRKAEITSRTLALKTEESKADTLIRDTKKEMESIGSEIEGLEKNEKEDEEKIASYQAEIAEGNKQMDIGQTTYHREASKLESLKTLMEHYDGYGNGIRRVMEEKPNEPGIKGVVAELLKVEKKYELAIETALGSKSKNIVTDNETTAKKMIEFLKVNKLGRATFLPLTNLEEVKKFEQPDVLSEEGVLGLASSLVDTEKGFEVLKGYLLGRTVVVDHIDHALRIGNKYRHGLYMVTLQGELFTPGGSITGGAFKNSSTLLGRKRDIDELTVNVDRLKKEMDEMQKSIDGKRAARNALRDEVVELQAKLQDARIRQNTAQLKIRQAEDSLQASRTGAISLDKENEEIAGQIAEVRSSSASIQKEIQASEEKEKELNETASALQAKEDELQKLKDKQSFLLEGVHVKYAGLTQQSGFLSSNLERLEREMAALAAEDEGLTASMDSGIREADEKRAKIEEVRTAIEEAKQASEENVKKEQEYISRKQELSESHKGFFSQRDQLSERLAQLDKECFRLNTQKEHLEESRDAQTTYMWEEYEITPNQAKGMRNPEYTERSSLKKDVNRLKEEIRQLGDVNVNAIEDYKALVDRHTFLSTQHDDLVKSEETLQNIIEELDKGMRRQFNEKFADINTEFNKVFKELFGGGTGRLELEPDVDVLEAGVNIISQPPGKKLQNMMQLSGGEKSLTAIALLFAIQNLKPSPFCLLDEIEAALDDPNVTRFAEYLHKLTKNTQFIIITHRRGTMAAADRLYGITMQEKGVSALVSVSLIEDKLDA
ncbi:MAG: chromosome segregation protein SMC [Lachnospiraceae bacterium]|jgi:chromosome segregation protein|nr:chromosome segregation protein SMC [Lachnospiraceae bacterium]